MWLVRSCLIVCAELMEFQMGPVLPHCWAGSERDGDGHDQGPGHGEVY